LSVAASTLRLSALFVHPVKGARAVPVAEATVEPSGLSHDRRWMVVDDTGEFVTQRELPTLALIDVRVDAAGALDLRAHGRAPLTVPATATGERREVRVWGDSCSAVSAGAGAAVWLSEALGRRCELVQLPAGAEREVDPEYARGARVGFADGFPFLIATAASLDELNRRLAAPVDMRRFRPNLVIEGSAPHEEDTWREIAVGALRFTLVKPCARCAVITVDPDRGERGKEPLATLAGYRAPGGDVHFGQNAVLSRSLLEARPDAPAPLRYDSSDAVLRVGDPVVVIERRAEG
jgi:hypothetical protein